MKQSVYKFWLASSSISLCCLAITQPTQAQIVPDTTLPVNSIVNSTDKIHTINGGTRVGDNLFHSFEQFSVPTDNTAVFNNALDVQNIFSRVTGSSVSKIDGLLQTQGTANLFLLNPNGIIFGSNAKLKIDGSFLATTANSLNFADGTQFSATATQTTPLLTVSVPVGLQYGTTTGAIRVQQSRLEVQTGKTLALVGGNVFLEGGSLTGLGGRIELGGLAENGTVGLEFSDNYLRLSFPDRLARANISLSSGARLESIPLSPETDGGDINIQAGSLSLTDNATITSGNLGQNGGSIFVQANSVSLTDSSISSDNFGEKGGNINIQANLLSLTNSHLRAHTSLGGHQAGSIFVQVGELASLSKSFISSSNFGGGGGDVNISAGSVSLTNDSKISATSGNEGSGRAGSVLVQASNSVFSANSLISSEALVGSFSESGNIRIEGGAISLTDNTKVTADNIEQGKAGDIFLQANSISLVNSSVLSAASGHPRAGEFSGVGKSGNIFLQANDSVYLANSLISNPLQLTSVGKAGDIHIEAGNITLIDGTQLIVNTKGRGDAGSVFLQARDSVFLSNSLLVSETEPGSEGKAGNISVKASSFTLNDDASLLVSTSNFFGSAGDPGSIVIEADLVKLNQGTMRAETSIFTGGNINIQSGSLQLRNSSRISTDRAGNDFFPLPDQNPSIVGGGGNITISTDTLATLENSSITTNSFESRGGRVEITTQGLFNSPSSAITASSTLGPQFDGVVTINTPDIDPSRGLIALPEIPVDPTRLVAQGCPADKTSRFSITGRGGLPPNPSEALGTDGVVVNWVTLESGGENISTWAISTSATRSTPTPSIEAQGFQRYANGDVLVTATSPAVTPYSSLSTPVSCHGS